MRSFLRESCVAIVTCICQFVGDIAGAVIAVQPGLVQDLGAIAAGSRERKVQRVGDVLGPHVGAQLPGDDIARIVIEHRRKIHPAPPDDLEVGKVGKLSQISAHLVRAHGLGMELVGGLDHDIGRAGDQIMGFQ